MTTMCSIRSGPRVWGPAAHANWPRQVGNVEASIEPMRVHSFRVSDFIWEPRKNDHRRGPRGSGTIARTICRGAFWRPMHNSTDCLCRSELSHGPSAFADVRHRNRAGHGLEGSTASAYQPVGPVAANQRTRTGTPRQAF